MLSGAGTDPETATVLIQTFAGFFSTVAFAILFGAPRNQYVAAGVVGAISWGFYFILIKYTGFSVIASTFATSFLTAVLARWTAVIRKCPITVFLICGLCPLIPGGGIFWTTYFFISEQYRLAMQSGITALSATIAIVLGIVVVTGLPKHMKKK